MLAFATAAQPKHLPLQLSCKHPAATLLSSSNASVDLVKPTACSCPSEELFDEYLASQEPLKLPAALQDIFWGHDCMAHAGLAPRLYAWLKVRGLCGICVASTVWQPAGDSVFVL